MLVGVDGWKSTFVLAFLEHCLVWCVWADGSRVHKDYQIFFNVISMLLHAFHTIYSTFNIAILSYM